MRQITVDCDLCGERIPLDRGKEALFQTGQNAYHLMDLCSGCLDVQLEQAETANDTRGYKKNAAVLLRLPDGQEPPKR